MRKMIIAGSVCFLFLQSNAQDAVQVIRGRVTSVCTGKAVAGASVMLSGPQSLTLYTDSSGNYKSTAPLGSYSILVNSKVYRSQLRSNIILLSGKQQVQDFELQEYAIQLDSVTIAVQPSENSVDLDLWDIQRFAAAFYDPARALTTYAGNINTDDQANNVSVHGTSPNFIQWKLEGVEVVNPNHLENAGTINDRPALNGGGVSLFSAQLLQNSGFQLSPFDPMTGNCLSGMFDMRLRDGNNEKHEHIIQASLLGTDISTEGPFSKRKNASFLVNYRFSTVGLLSKMGVNFGGEKINYQDISFTATLPYKNGKAKLFGMAGKSESIFKGAKDSATLLIQKDLLNIDYHSVTAITGVNALTSISNSLLWRSVLAYSVKKVDRVSGPGALGPMENTEKDLYSQQKISSLNYLSQRINAWSHVKMGSHINYFLNSVNTSNNEVRAAEGKIAELLFQPFVSYEASIRKVDVQLGLHSTYQVRTSEFILQPRAKLGWRVTERQMFVVRYGRSSQLQPYYLYLSDDTNRKLGQSISDAYAVEHHINFGKLKIKNELFYQDYSRLAENELQGFSAFNYFNEQVLYSLTSSGTAKVYGYDLTIEREHKDLYVIASASIYKSMYKMQDVFYDGRFNTNYNAALTVGKEYKLKNKNKTLGSDIRGFVRDGFREQDMYFYKKGLAVYYRVDLRISYRKNKTKSATIWALDMQNVTNRQNEAYHYYDKVTEKVETRYQLGLIPVLSYKILF